MQAMNTREVVADTRRRMQKTIEDMGRELASFRTGRATVHLLDSVTVDYYGSPTPLNQVANLHAPEPNLITVQPWDVSQIGKIERGILSSGLGFNPSNDGRIIRIPVPPLTEERRRSLAKQVGKVAEEHRTAVRQIRRDANDRLKKLEKDKVISEDDQRRTTDEIQKITDEFISQVDAVGKAKEDEILKG